MNVQNRKLFRNKDARRQLAAMGGIMRSSPELAGEAARFAEGGTARERAISGQGALDEFASSSRTPMILGPIDQALGSRVQDVDRQVQTAIVSFLGNVFQVVGDRIFHSDTGIEIEEPSLKQEILTQGDRIAAEDMAMAQDVPQGQPRNFTQLLSDIKNPVERGKAILTQSQSDQAQPSQADSSDGPDRSIDQQLLSKALEAKSLPITPTQDFRREFADYGDDISPFDPADIAGTIDEMNPAFDSFGGDLLRPVDLMAGPIYPAEEGSSETKSKRFNDALSNRPRMYETMFPVPAPEAVTLDLGPEGPTTSDGESTPIEFAVKPGSTSDAAALGTAGYTPDAAKDTALAAAEASNDPGASLSGTIGANLGAGSSSSIEEATKAQYEFLKDFLGIGERDKQKEFNLMAMQFFTALAAGQSPDALANLNAAASTAIAGLAAADKERTELDRSIKLAAFDRASELDSAAAARRQRMDELTKEYQLRTDLEIDKIEADAANTPGKPFLSTATGKALLAEYNLYIDPASGGLTPDQAFEKMTSSGGVARDPALITLFMKSLGYTSDNKVTPGQVQSLDQIPDGT